ncbi:MAG: response regulator transcription factor [Oscillospiraceae bacterium]|nr:response regulator transcription factor [Oscillospiraceae bacterium]
MMRIAICDDNQIDRDIIKDFLHTYLTEKSIPNTMTEYENGMNLICDIEEGYYCDLVFLDIFMDHILGMDIARRLRSVGYTGKIIFLTSTAEFAVDSYEVEASGYLLKPHDYEKLRSLLDRLIDRTNIGQFQVSVRNTIYSIPFGEIVYVESRNNVCILHRSDGREYTIYKKLSEVGSQLNDSRFLRCHQSYLINMSYIAKADKQFELTTGDVVLIRQRNQKEIRRAYQEFASKGVKV